MSRFSELHGTALEIAELVRDKLLGSSNPGAPADPVSSLDGVGLAHVSATARVRCLYALIAFDRVPEHDRAEALRDMGATDA